MLPKSSDTVDRVLQYTAVAADALQDVANTAQIPFLDTVCTLVLKIVPIAQVRQSHSAHSMSSLNVIGGHKVSKRSMSLHDGKDSPITLRTYELVRPFR
jgi:hypothetical protein